MKKRCTYILTRIVLQTVMSEILSVHTLFGKCWSAWTGGKLWALNHLKAYESYPISFFCCFATGWLYYQCFLVCEESFGVNGECCLVSQWKVEVTLVVEEAAAASGSAPVAVLSLQGSPLPCTHRRNSVTKRTQIHTHSRHSPSPFLKRIPVLSVTSRFSLKMFSRLNRNVRSSFQSIHGWSSPLEIFTHRVTIFHTTIWTWHLKISILETIALTGRIRYIMYNSLHLLR